MPVVALSGMPTWAWPEMVGTALLVNTPLAMELVGGLCAVPLWAPALVAVTWARRRWPTWAAVGWKALVVAPAMGLPLASHWKWNVRLPWLQEPRLVTSFWPTCGVPVTVGATVLRTTVSRTWMKPLGHSELVSEMVRVS